MSLLCPSEILVTGAGLSAINGVYYQAGTRTYQEEDFPNIIVTRFIYSKDKAIDSKPRIDFSSPQPSLFKWVILDDVFYYSDVELYETNIANYQVFPNCPTDLSFTATDLAYAAAPNIKVDPVVQRNDNHKIDGESGGVRFRRLFNLGYV